MVSSIYCRIYEDHKSGHSIQEIAARHHRSPNEIKDIIEHEADQTALIELLSSLPATPAVQTRIYNALMRARIYSVEHLKETSVQQLLFLPNMSHKTVNILVKSGAVDATAKERKMLEDNDSTGKIKVKIPGGYLMVEAKGAEDEYPGVFISFSEDGKTFDTSRIIACTEYDSCTGEILTETYKKDKEEPNHIVVYEDGRDKCC